MDISEMATKPLKPAAFHILLALAGQDAHGYGVMQTVREQSGGRVPIQTGSFYRHLTGLIEDGLVSESPGPKEAEDPRRGIYYHLTARGRQALDREREYLRDVVAALERVRPRKATS